MPTSSRMEIETDTPILVLREDNTILEGLQLVVDSGEDRSGVPDTTVTLDKEKFYLARKDVALVEVPLPNRQTKVFWIQAPANE